MEYFNFENSLCVGFPHPLSGSVVFIYLFAFVQE